MNRSQILEEINNIFIEIIEDKDVVISESTTAEDIDEWDSLTLLGFIAMIENEYSIQINVPNLNIDLSFNDFYNKYLVSI